MGKFVLFLTFLGIFGASLAIDDKVLVSLTGGLSDLGQDGLVHVTSEAPTLFNLLKGKYPDFDYTFKRIVSGKSQVVAGSRYYAKIEVTPKDHADQVKNCDLDYVEDLKHVFTKIELKCDDKTYTYEK